MVSAQFRADLWLKPTESPAPSKEDGLTTVVGTFSDV